MFESLSEKLSSVFDRLRGRGFLNEAEIDTVLREIRITLLEADVAIPATKGLLAHVKQELMGKEMIKSLSPSQTIIKAVHDALVEFLGREVVPLNSKANSPFSYLFVGLQGAGKTTSVAKVANLLKKNLHILMVSLDIYRPAAREQLRILGESLGIPVLDGGDTPHDIMQKGLNVAKKNNIDLILWDTAGRLQVDGEMMQELAEIYTTIRPVETLLVADAMIGQEAIHVAKSFHDIAPLTGAILTRADGDMRGGAALSIRYATGCPLKFLGTGEAISKLIPFDPKRIAGQILDRGDVIQFVEKAQQVIDQEDATRIEKRLAKGRFDLNDMRIYLEKMQNMGGFLGVLKLLPGAQKVAAEAAQKGLDKEEADKKLRRQIALIQSMTPHERQNPKILNGSRRKRIATGAGQTVTELNHLIKQFEQTQSLMKKFSQKSFPSNVKQVWNSLRGRPLR